MTCPGKGKKPEYLQSSPAAEAAMDARRARSQHRWTKSKKPSSARKSGNRSEEHTSELQSPCNLVCRLFLLTKYKLPRDYIGQHYMVLNAERRANWAPSW